MRMSRRMGLLHSDLTDLTNTGWVFNEIVQIPRTMITDSYALDFLSGSEGETHALLKFSYFTMSSDSIYAFTYDNISSPTVYYIYREAGTHNWRSEFYKALYITGGADATNATLIAWLQTNATQTA